MEIKLSLQQRQFLQQQIEYFYTQLDAFEINPIRAALRSVTVPPTIKAVQDLVERWRKLFTPSPEAPEGQPITNDYAPLIKAALFERRRTLATDVDQRLEKTLHPEAIAILKAELAPFDEWE